MAKNKSIKSTYPIGTIITFKNPNYKKTFTGEVTGYSFYNKLEVKVGKRNFLVTESQIIEVIE
jgi:hypothetical protein